LSYGGGGGPQKNPVQAITVSTPIVALCPLRVKPNGPTTIN